MSGQFIGVAMLQDHTCVLLFFEMFIQMLTTNSSIIIQISPDGLPYLKILQCHYHIL